MLASSVFECGVLSLEWCVVVFFKRNDPGDLIHHATQGLSKCFPCCEMRGELCCDFPKSQYPHLFYSESLMLIMIPWQRLLKGRSLFIFFLFICCSTKDLFQNWRLWSLGLFSIFSWHIDLGSNLGNISFICQIYFSVWKVTQLFIKNAAFKIGNRARVWCINLSGPL